MNRGHLDMSINIATSMTRVKTYCQKKQHLSHFSDGDFDNSKYIWIEDSSFHVLLRDMEANLGTYCGAAPEISPDYITYCEGKFTNNVRVIYFVSVHKLLNY